MEGARPRPFIFPSYDSFPFRGYGLDCGSIIRPAESQRREQLSAGRLVAGRPVFIDYLIDYL